MVRPDQKSQGILVWRLIQSQTQGMCEAVKWMRDDSDRETSIQKYCYEPGREVEMK